VGLRAALSLAAAAAGVVLVLLLATRGHADQTPLRVCADPNALPASNAQGEGFENRIAALLADELGTPLSYTWWAQRRGFVRNSLNAGLCDVILGVPVGFDPVLTTRAYYRSTYVFVWRRERALGIRSLDDPRLRALTVGVQLVGDDGINTPPAHALARRGIVSNVRGFTVFGDHAQPSPQTAILRAVAEGVIDVAMVWGPLAGFFASRLSTPLELAPIAPDDPPGLRFTFAMAAGVRKGDAALRDRLQAALDRRAPDIRAVLDAYGVPRAEPTPP
jgi:mxaJ protein